MTRQTQTSDSAPVVKTAVLVYVPNPVPYWQLQNLVDLAGSETLDMASNTTSQRETGNINVSLSHLKTVIHVLTTGDAERLLFMMCSWRLLMFIAMCRIGIVCWPNCWNQHWEGVHILPLCVLQVPQHSSERLWSTSRLNIHWLYLLTDDENDTVVWWWSW